VRKDLDRIDFAQARECRRDRGNRILSGFDQHHAGIRRKVREQFIAVLHAAVDHDEILRRRGPGRGERGKRGARIGRGRMLGRSCGMGRIGVVLIDSGCRGTVEQDALLER